MVKLTFNKALFLQHIRLNIFRWMFLKYENYSLTVILFETFKQQSVNCLGQQKPKCKSESYLGNKEQNAMFPLVFRSDGHFDFASLFFACPIGRARKIDGPKNLAI